MAKAGVLDTDRKGCDVYCKNICETPITQSLFGDVQDWLIDNIPGIGPVIDFFEDNLIYIVYVVVFLVIAKIAMSLNLFKRRNTNG
jgi:hypothetical protein